MSALTEQFFKMVGRHFVTLSCVQHPPGNTTERVFVFSGFVVEAGGVWFHITAGHILRDIRTFSETGGTFDVWRFDDQTAGHTFKVSAIPFAFEIDNWVVIEDAESGLDYAVVALDTLTRRQLEAGGVIPIGRDAWGDHVSAHDHWALVGIPSETVEYDRKTVITARIVVMPITPAEEPELAGKKAENQFYARIQDLGNITDIDGMSGGPVFALRKAGDKWSYKVIGVQSAWYPRARTVAACPFSSLGIALEDVVTSAAVSTMSDREHR